MVFMKLIKNIIILMVLLQVSTNFEKAIIANFLKIIKRKKQEKRITGKRKKVI